MGSCLQNNWLFHSSCIARCYEHLPIHTDGEQYWLDRGNGTSSHTAPAGFNNAVFYFTAQANHIYTFDTIATIMKNK